MDEFEKYKLVQTESEKLISLNELENDIKKIGKPKQ